VSLKELHDEYKVFCCTEDCPPDKKKYFKQQMIAAIGPMGPKSNGNTNYWRGWRVKSADYNNRTVEKTYTRVQTTRFRPF